MVVVSTVGPFSGFAGFGLGVGFALADEAPLSAFLGVALVAAFFTGVAGFGALGASSAM
ncbi:hypothetical protein G4G27_09720 [Sphingomonas sp. So64.6b]|uniref:hypothetical protein n=1 Tax=Sphingomonas sp. So64.6b TaxID=2997354 RepID=UPI00160455D4|nr:hypothetical protein [Sphingomonas sp. So64.6b]QNA84231.1 hypothetical protein G4G27_09720 [Sphingomonas sp. So64.6b]